MPLSKIMTVLLAALIAAGGCISLSAPAFAVAQAQAGHAGGAGQSAVADDDGDDADDEEDEDDEDEDDEEGQTRDAAGASDDEDDREVSLDDLTEEQLTEAVEFTIGNAMFIMFHEAGHMLVSELGLPVLGREEDAVDLLSTVLMLEARNDTLDKAVTDAADGWFLSAEHAGDDAELAFWDSHGLDEQRAYQIVCMMVGHDGDGFKEYADSIDYPADRRDECAAEYQQARQSWFTLLESHRRGDAGKPAKVEIVYEPAGSEELQLYADIIKKAGILENTADIFADLYKLNDGIRFIGKACGQPNAFWNGSARELTFCYEFPRFHMALIADWLVKHPDE